MEQQKSDLMKLDSSVIKIINMNSNPQEEKQIENKKVNIKKKCYKIKVKLNKMNDNNEKRIRNSSASSGRSSSTTRSISSISNYQKQSQRIVNKSNTNVVLSKEAFESEKIKIKEKIQKVKTKFAKINLNSHGNRILDHYKSIKQEKQLLTESEQRKLHPQYQQLPQQKQLQNNEQSQEYQEQFRQQYQQKQELQKQPHYEQHKSSINIDENKKSSIQEKSASKSSSKSSSSSLSVGSLTATEAGLAGTSAVVIDNIIEKDQKIQLATKPLSEATINNSNNALKPIKTEIIKETDFCELQIEMPDNETKNSRQKRRKRNRKEKKDCANTSGITATTTKKQNKDVYNLEIDNNKFKLNAETLLILDLFSMPEEEREEFLVDLAKTKKILIENQTTGSFEFNPKIGKLKSILYHGNSVWKLNDNIKDRIEAIANQKGPSKEDQLRTITPKTDQTKKEKSRPLFEDLINAVVLEGLNDEQKKEYEYVITSRRQRENIRNHVHSKNFTKDLESYAQKCVQGGLGVIIEGDIRINAKNNQQAFIKLFNGKKDAMFTSQLIRKCALHGDIVRAFIRINSNDGNGNQKDSTTINNDNNGNCSINQDNIQNELSFNNSIEESITTAIDDFIDDDEPLEIAPERSAKGFVIQILEEIHNRRCVGSFLSYRLDSEYITFVPRDTKMPNIRIYEENWPENFIKGQMANIQDTLYVAEIIDWIRDICIGKIIQPVGKCGELEVENYAILLQNNLKIIPYDDKINEMFYGPIKITSEDMEMRKDLRSECIFTIDPLTARDLDDAVSCKKLLNGYYEIGVHISDVSHFLYENSELDLIVKQRTTSIYMVNEVFHMLPKSLCLKCSLLPGEDKFAFSVMWEITENGEIINVKFYRTIINSCVQLAYEHVQKIIDYPDRNFTEDDFPMIHNGFNIEEIIEKIKCLHLISEKLRSKRFENGAIRINRPKLYFDLDPETGAPINYGVCQLDTANYLIEEFMLLANQSVAKFIYEKFPKISILRQHDPPISNVLKKIKERLNYFSMDLDITNSKALYSSLLKLSKQFDNSDAMEVILSHLISKPMTRAKYICSDTAVSEDAFWHYALSIPIYTHFTSPIRRYPDILVHRLLSAALGYSLPPVRTPEQLIQITKQCNEDKSNAKNAGDDSAMLYFIHYVKSKKSIPVRAIILDISRHVMEVILVETGHLLRVPYPRDDKNVKITIDTKNKPYTAQLIYPNAPELGVKDLKMFTEILIEIYVEKQRLKAKMLIPSIPSKDSLPSTSSNTSKSNRNDGSNVEENGNNLNKSKSDLGLKESKNNSEQKFSDDCTKKKLKEKNENTFIDHKEINYPILSVSPTVSLQMMLSSSLGASKSSIESINVNVAQNKIVANSSITPEFELKESETISDSEKNSLENNTNKILSVPLKISLESISSSSSDTVKSSVKDVDVNVVQDEDFKNSALIKFELKLGKPKIDLISRPLNDNEKILLNQKEKIHPSTNILQSKIKTQSDSVKNSEYSTPFSSVACEEKMKISKDSHLNPLIENNKILLENYTSTPEQKYSMSRFDTFLQTPKGRTSVAESLDDSSEFKSMITSSEGQLPFDLSDDSWGTPPTSPPSLH